MALYQLTREFAQAGTRDEVVWQLIGEINRVFHATAAVVLPGSKSLAAHPDSSLALTDKELHVAEWSFLNRQPAGKFTDNLPGADALHLPLVTEHSVVGVLSVQVPEKTLPLARRDLLEAYARQAALVLDRVALRAAGEQSKLVAESERLSNALLNSISHELRTPLAAITSATGALAESQPKDGGFDRKMVAEIQEAATRLNRLVGNLLDMTRLESGHMKLRREWCDLADLASVALRQLEKELARHPVTNNLPRGLPLVQIDFVLMEQVLVNLLLNAALHTPPGTRVILSAEVGAKDIALSVADNGPGIAPEALPHLFNKFYRAPGAAAGGSGLGLSIVKGFVDAHGGQVSAQNRPGGGAEFTVRLPLQEAPPSLEASL